MNNSVMVRDDIPTAIRDNVRTKLLTLDETNIGQTILAGMETAAFHPADDASYDRVRNYINEFEKTVRPVEQP